MKLIYGLLFSVVVGGVVVWSFWFLLGKLSDLPTKNDAKNKVHNNITGTMERVFFTLMVAWRFEGVLAAMIGWLALKLAANWNHKSRAEGNPKVRASAIRAVVVGLLSMLFAAAGGLIARGEGLW